MDQVGSKNLSFPLWFLPKWGKGRACRFLSLDGAALYIEYYHPIHQIGVDLAKTWVLLDDYGRRLDAVIDQGTAIRCDLAELEPTGENLGLLERLKTDADYFS